MIPWHDVFSQKFLPKNTNCHPQHLLGMSCLDFYRLQHKYAWLSEIMKFMFCWYYLKKYFFKSFRLVLSIVFKTVLLAFTQPAALKTRPYQLFLFSFFTNLSFSLLFYQIANFDLQGYTSHFMDLVIFFAIYKIFS